MALKQRNEMDKAFQWDFSHIYPTYEAWEKAYADVQGRLSEVTKFAGKLGDGVEAIKEALDCIYAIEQEVELVYLYAMLHKSADNGDPKYQEMQGKAMNLIVALSTNAAYLSPEIVSLPKETIDEYLASDLLKTYHHNIADSTRTASHVLTQRPRASLQSFTIPQAQRRTPLKCLKALT